MKRKQRLALKEELRLAIKNVLTRHQVEMKRGTERGIRKSVRKMARQAILRDAEPLKM